MARPSCVNLGRGRTNYTGSGALKAIASTDTFALRYPVLVNRSADLALFNLYQCGIERSAPPNVGQAVTGKRIDIFSAGG